MRRSNVIEQMVRGVQAGFTPRSVFAKVVESSLTWHPGSMVKVNKNTTAKKVNSSGQATGEEVPLKQGENVSILGAGSGPSGNDEFVRLPDGTPGSVPYYDLGEGLIRSKRRSRREDIEPGDQDAEPGSKDLENDDDPTVGGEPTRAEDGGDDDERVVRVELMKPLSPEAEDWLKGDHKEVEGLELPDMPEADEPDHLSFLMKAKDQEALGSAVGSLKKVAGESLVKIEPADRSEWKRSE